MEIILDSEYVRIDKKDYQTIHKRCFVKAFIGDKITYIEYSQDFKYSKYVTVTLKHFKKMFIPYWKYASQKDECYIKSDEYF